MLLGAKVSCELFPDGLMVGRVDERVHADVEQHQDHRHVIEVIVVGDTRVDAEQNEPQRDWEPHDGV